MSSKIKKPERKYKSQYAQEFPWIKRGRDDFHAHCTLCKDEISLASTGKTAITRHRDTPKHQAASKAASSSQSLANFLPSHSAPTPVDEKTTAAEGTWAYHTVMHHQSFISTECVSSQGLFRT